MRWSISARRCGEQPRRRVGVLDFGSRTFVFENGKLLPKSKVFYPKVVVGFEQKPDEPDIDPDE